MVFLFVLQGKVSTVYSFSGWDALDRRIEVEKKEKYGQALRDQMAQNSARGSPSPPSRTGETTATSPLPPSRPSSCSRAGEVIASPHSMMHGSVVTDSSPASKVAQVQELMRQRLQAVQEEQQRQWQEIQHALNSQLHAARDAAEEAVRSQFGEVISGQAAEMQALRKALSDMMQAQRHNEEQSAQSGRHVDALAGELADARAALQRVEAESGAWQSQLRGLNAAVEELARAKQEQVAQQDATQRELAEARNALQRLQFQNDDVLNRLQSQAQEMERLRAEKQDSASAHAECARDRASLAQRLSAVESGLTDAQNQRGSQVTGSRHSRLVSACQCVFPRGWETMQWKSNASR